MASQTPRGTDVFLYRHKVHEALLAMKDSQEMFDQELIQNLPCMRDICKRDPDILLAVINSFLSTCMFKTIKFGDGDVRFKLRAEVDYKKYQKLDTQQIMVYEQIEESGGDGIWLKTIRMRTNMHESAVNSAIKHLMSLGFITDLKNVANSNRRMYIKVGIAQSERSTGGPWYTDGELDEPFVNTIMDVLYQKIFADSVQASKAGRHAVDRYQRKKMDAKAKEEARAKQPKKGTKAVTPAEAKALRDRALGSERTDLEKQREQLEEYKLQRTIYDEFCFYPAGYVDYPKIDPLTYYVLESGVCHEGVVLTAADIGLVLDIMVLDKRIEEVDCGKNGIGYKVTRQSLKPLKDTYNVFTEAPCGRCPVFDLCEEGGPVGPSNCEYFNKWLGVTDYK